MRRRQLKVQSYDAIREKFEQHSAEAAEAQRKADEARAALDVLQEQRDVACETVRALVAEFNLTNAEIYGPAKERSGRAAKTAKTASDSKAVKAARKSGKGTKRPAKFKWKGQKWSGQGTEPRWVTAYKAGGGKMEDIRVWWSPAELRAKAKEEAAGKPETATNGNGTAAKRRGRPPNRPAKATRRVTGRRLAAPAQAQGLPA